MIWEALSKLALLGTERGHLPAEVEQALGQVGVQTAQEPEAVLLEGAALYHQLRRAGLILPEGQPRTSISSTSAPPLPPRAAGLMGYIIRGNFRAALPEALRLLQNNGYAIPPECLPALFYKSAKDQSFWHTLRPLLASSDFELLRVNPDWGGLAERAPEANWSGFSQQERLQMLRHVRFNQPQQAPQYLSGCWDGLAPAEKKEMLQELGTGLGPDDQPFLEERLSDSRKEVRQTAARLLLLIPGSPLQDKLFDNAVSWLSLSKGNRLELHAAQQANDEFRKLGLYSTKKHQYSGGSPSGRAYDLLSKIPPKRWEAHFGKSTLDTLRLFTRGQQQNLLTDAVINAALLHEDHRWIEALLRHWWRTGNEARWNSTLGRQLMTALPDAIANELLAQHLRQHQGYIKEDSFAGQLLCLGEHQWEDRVAQAVLSHFREWLNAAQSVYWDMWHYKKILQVAAYQAPVSLLEGFRTGWNNRAPVWGNWERDIERFIKTLSFRKDLTEAMAPNRTS